MNIVILLYKGFTALDVIGPYEVLTRLPNAEVKFAAKESGLIESEYAAMKMVATHTLAEIEQADILMIPLEVMLLLNGLSVFVEELLYWLLQGCLNAKRPPLTGLY